MPAEGDVDVFKMSRQLRRGAPPHILARAFRVRCEAREISSFTLLTIEGLSNKESGLRRCLISTSNLWISVSRAAKRPKRPLKIEAIL
jgi:hypothetical protein